MAHFIETPKDTAQGEATAKPSRKVVLAALSFVSRLAQIFYAILSSAFAAGVLVQVFFAGMGAFGADWSYHVTFGHLLEPLPMLMIGRNATRASSMRMPFCPSSMMAASMLLIGGPAW